MCFLKIVKSRKQSFLVSTAVRSTLSTKLKWSSHVCIWCSKESGWFYNKGLERFIFGIFCDHYFLFVIMQPSLFHFYQRLTCFKRFRILMHVFSGLCFPCLMKKLENAWHHAIKHMWYCSIPNNFSDLAFCIVHVFFMYVFQTPIRFIWCIHCLQYFWIPAKTRSLWMCVIHSM